MIDRALAKDREARYASCHNLQADLEALLVTLGQNISAARNLGLRESLRRAGSRAG